MTLRSVSLLEGRIAEAEMGESLGRIRTMNGSAVALSITEAKQLVHDVRLLEGLADQGPRGDENG